MKNRILASALAFFMLASLAVTSVGAVETQVPGLTFLTEAKYDGFGDLSEGLVWVQQGTTVQYLDAAGKVVIADPLSKLRTMVGSGFDLENVTMGEFHNGLARIYYTAYEEDFSYIQHAVYLNKDGSVAFAIEDGFNYSLGHYAAGVVLAYPPTEDYVEVYDKTGASRIVQNDFGADAAGTIVAMQFNDGLVPFYMYTYDEEYSDSKNGYYDTNFKIAIPAQFEDVRPFHGGLAPACQNGLWGFIDKTGKFVIQPQFEDFWVHELGFAYQVFVDGYASVCKDGKWGLIDKTGKVVVPFTQEKGLSFHQGLAAVNGGYINLKGEKVITTTYADLNYFIGGHALVGNYGNYTFIDTAGKQATTQTWNFASTIVSDNSAAAGLVFYQQGEKWGLAKITYGPGEVPVITPPQTATAKPTASSVVVNGKAVSFDAYNINDNNYFKLRDLAFVLNGTGKQFQVTWDQANNAIALESGKAYTAVGGEMTGKGAGDKQASLTTSKVLLNGAEISLTAYNIADNNYFKLRDVGQAFNFDVTWDGAQNTIVIDTTKSYTPD